jgi:hypothetical protein
MANSLSVQLLELKIYELIDDASKEKVEELAKCITDFAISRMTSSYQVPKLVKKALTPSAFFYVPTIGVVAKHANSAAEKILLLDSQKMSTLHKDFPTWQKWASRAKPLLSLSSSLYQMGCSAEEFVRNCSYSAVTYLGTEIIKRQNFSEDELRQLSAEWDKACASSSALYNSIYEPVTRTVASGLTLLIAPQIKKQVALLGETIPLIYSKIHRLDEHYLGPQIMGQLLFHSVADTLELYRNVHKDLKTKEYIDASPVKKIILFLQKISTSHNIPGFTADEILQLTEENYESEMERAVQALVETELLTKLLPLITPPQLESINHLLGIIFHKSDSQGIINHLLGQFIGKKLSVLTDSSKRYEMMQNLIKSKELPMGFSSKEDLHNAYLRIFLPKVISPLKEKKESFAFLRKKIKDFGTKEAVNFQQHPLFSISHLFLLDKISTQLTCAQAEISEQIFQMQGAAGSASAGSACRSILPADRKKMTENLTFIYLEEKRFQKILRPLISQALKLKPVQSAFEFQVPKLTLLVESSVNTLKKNKLVKKLAELEGLDPLHYPALLIFLDQHLLQYEELILNKSEEKANEPYLDRLLQLEDGQALRKMLSLNQKIIKIKTRKVVKRQEKDIRGAFLNSLKGFHVAKTNLKNHQESKEQIHHLIQDPIHQRNVELLEAAEQIEAEIQHDKEMLAHLSSWRA